MQNDIIFNVHIYIPGSCQNFNVVSDPVGNMIRIEKEIQAYGSNGSSKSSDSKLVVENFIYALFATVAKLVKKPADTF